MLFEVLATVLLLTNIVTIVLLFTKPKKQEKVELTKDATELLSELTRGGAIVVTQVVDPATVFQWSPKS